MSESKHLLPQVKRYFKANLHTHTTISDGKFTPEEIKEHYKASGYQIMSYTDHNVIVPHPELDDEEFLTLTGVEYNVSAPDYSSLLSKTCHLNFIAKDPNNLVQPFTISNPKPEREKYYEHVRFDDLRKAYEPEALNELIAWGNRNGFLVMYNHPTWSLQDYTDYAPLKGLWGMEVCNFGCVTSGHDEFNDRVYRDMLRLGNRLYPVGSDDTHAPKDLTGAWIMVGAENLAYAPVIEALEKGDFYASTGPEIHSLTLEGNNIKVTCSDAQEITLDSNCRFAKRAVPAPRAAFVREATFDITRWVDECTAAGIENAYIRITVKGPYGHRATTRAYWLDELK